MTVGRELMAETATIGGELRARFPAEPFPEQATRDGIPTFWVSRDALPEVLRFLKNEVAQPYPMLWDLTAIDERERRHREGQPPSDFTAVYHLLSFDRNADVRLKVALTGEKPSMPTITGLWPSSDWYEREAWDMFGIGFDGHPNLRRILSPPWWEGHPLRKEHPARATDMGPFTLPIEKWEQEEEMLKLRPADWGLTPPPDGDDEVLFLNVGPQHPGHARRAPHRAAAARRGDRRSARPTSAITTAARKRWASARPGTPTFPTPTASTTSAG